MQDESRGDLLAVSGLVVDELAYRSVLAWLRDDGDGDPLTTYRGAPGAVTRAMAPRLATLWDALDTLGPAVAVCDAVVIARARSLMGDPGLAPRDAFHAAHALEAGCATVVSADADFDRVRQLSRLGP